MSIENKNSENVVSDFLNKFGNPNRLDDIVNGLHDSTIGNVITYFVKDSGIVITKSYIDLTIEKLKDKLLSDFLPMRRALQELVDKLDLNNPDDMAKANAVLKDYHEKAFHCFGEVLSQSHLTIKPVDLRAMMYHANKPHEEGTTAELSEKYGLSKSEVRRRKREGISFS
jgi:hypothetical protein